MIVGAYEGESAKNVLARQRRALTIKIGQRFRINGKNYRVEAIYPHIVKLKCGDKQLFLNKGDLVVLRSGNGFYIEEEAK